MNPTVSDIVLIGPVRTGKHFDLLTRFLRHHPYYDLAKFTVYTKGKTPEETCADIIRLTGSKALGQS